MTEKPHERLDRLMNDRRLELGKRWGQVADDAKIKPETLRSLRRGKNAPTEDTQRGVERALGWAAGSVDAILGGGDPTPGPMHSAGAATIHVDLDATARGEALPRPTEEELRGSGLAPDIIEMALAIRDRLDRWLAEADERNIKSTDRFTRAIDDDHEETG